MSDQSLDYFEQLGDFSCNVLRNMGEKILGYNNYQRKKFTDCETRYSLLEKTCCALARAAPRLRQYMLTHTTLLVSKMDPIKYIFDKPALSGRIARWRMILTEYDIQYTT